MGKRCFNDNRVRIINNSIETENFVFNLKFGLRCREELGIGDSTLLLVTKEVLLIKNHDFLIVIFKKVSKKNRNTLLLLVGDSIAGSYRKKS